MKSKSKVYQLSDDEFRELIATHESYSACLRALGLSTFGSGSRQFIKRRVKELSIDTSHFKRGGRKSAISYRYPLEAILCKDSFYCHTESLKRRLVRAGLIEYKCAFCGNTGEWNGESLVLQLDHINGDHFDNRLENLRLLCPNCHSQTKTYAGKNEKGVHKPGEKPSESFLSKNNGEIKTKIEKKNAERIEKIRNAKIDFHQRGWAKEVNKILGFAYTSHVPQWLKKNMPEEYVKTWDNSVASRVDVAALVKEYCETDITLKDLAAKNNIADESARCILAKAGIYDTSRKPFSNKNAVYYHHKIMMDDEDGEHVFDSMKDIEDYLLDKDIVTEKNKVRVKVNIGRCLNGARKTAFKRIWKLA